MTRCKAGLRSRGVLTLLVSSLACAVAGDKPDSLRMVADDVKGENPAFAGGSEVKSPNEAPRKEPQSRRWWSDAAETALAEAGGNRDEILQALRRAPKAQREGLQFIVENMPRQDLETLSADFLLENLQLAYQALAGSRWAGNIPSEIFLNEVLPYASLSEPRENSRAKLRAICLPLVKDCQTPAEAGRALNEKLFRALGVRYSLKRRRTDQGPLETMELHVATCTGLSILLVDACRAVGVPARVVGTPDWVNGRGNHTWVEIWDGGWHFAGAAEPHPNGLDHAWFIGNASQAVRDNPEHAIYASSFRKTGLKFILSWNRQVDYVSAVNVTERYASKAKRPDTSATRLLVSVLDRPGGRRVAAKVTVTDAANSAVSLKGKSKGESTDLNHLLAFELPRQNTYLIEVEHGRRKQRQQFQPGNGAESTVVICLSGSASFPQTGAPENLPTGGSGNGTTVEESSRRHLGPNSTTAK